jgi:hypothetical protein
MFGVAFFSEESQDLTDQWGYLLMAFGLQKQAWEIGGKHIRWANHIDSVAEIPKEAPLVLFSPRNGVEPSLRGVMSLDNFWHPMKATYLFGPTHRPLTREDLAGRSCDQRVSIDLPTDTELFPATAASMALWDRMTKGLPLG